MGGEAPRRMPSSYPVFAERPVGAPIESIYRDRLQQFTATGQYQDHNLVAYGLLVPPLILTSACFMVCMLGSVRSFELSNMPMSTNQC